MPTEINEEHRKNLNQLADFLLGATLPKFNMHDYMRCAIGHGPLAGIPKEKSDHHSSVYSIRVFGCGPDENGKVFSWLFGPRWKWTDNTPQGAAKRIKWFLEHGLPSNLYEQLRGEEPLCYIDA